VALQGSFGIVAATPGRVCEFLDTHKINLYRVRSTKHIGGDCDGDGDGDDGDDGCVDDNGDDD
jgi:hypothetical protein